MVNWKKWFLEEDEDEIYEEGTVKKEKKDDLAERREKRAENRRKERVYLDEEEDFEIDFSSNKSKKSFDEDEFSSQRSTRKRDEKEEEKFEDYEEVNLDDFEVDNYDDFEDYEDDYEEELEQEKKSKKENGFISKFKGLFSSNKKEDEEFLDDEYLDEEDDEAEDYKTYLERQKREQKEKSKIVEKKYDGSDYEDEEDYEDDYEEENEKKVGFFSRLKDKLFNVSDDEIDQEELDAVLDDFEEELAEEKKTDKRKVHSKEEKVLEKAEDELEIEFVEEKEQNVVPVFEEINIAEYEEKEEVVSARKVTDLGDVLKKLGVENSEIRDVDIFDENPPRRTHPTLAAVRTKRLKQDHKIDTLGDSVVLGKDSIELKEEVANRLKEKVQEETIVQEERVTKNSEARKEFEENFNILERRSDKIEKDNPLYTKKNEKLDGIFDEIRDKEIKTHEKETPELEVRELDAEGSRREKLKYTSVNDVLEGAEDLFEDDIDRVSKKLVGDRFEGSQETTEDVENFRKGLYEGKKVNNSQEKTALDELIETENIDISPKKEETLPEIEELNENLEDLIKDKKEEFYVDLVREAAKIEDIEVEDYEELKDVKKDRLSGYSDYHLDEEEIEELEEQNYLEESVDSVNIDSLLREVSPNNKVVKVTNDVDKFTDEKVVPKEVAQKRVEDVKTYQEDEEDEVERGIDYIEKLYTNDVSEYFDKGNGTKLGEYKTVDHGYRPVSKEKIENNQKILDAIFEKYSSSGLSASTKSVTSQMMSSNTITPKTRNVGKFKPSPVYSSVYGSATRNTAESSNKQVGISTTGLSINDPVKTTIPEVKKTETQSAEKKTVEAKKVENSVQSNANIYKEIASQEETVWNIGSSKRVPKNKVKSKK